eukprot:Amastigsp_a842449_4.p2 type:complete len:214 gc:universal Amastigsp_a842449_4:614-1255(+)
MRELKAVLQNGHVDRQARVNACLEIMMEDMRHTGTNENVSVQEERAKPTCDDCARVEPLECLGRGVPARQIAACRVALPAEEMQHGLDAERLNHAKRVKVRGDDERRDLGHVALQHERPLRDPFEAIWTVESAVDRREHNGPIGCRVAMKHAVCQPWARCRRHVVMIAQHAATISDGTVLWPLVIERLGCHMREVGACAMRSCGRGQLSRRGR